MAALFTAYFWVMELGLVPNTVIWALDLIHLHCCSEIKSAVSPQLAMRIGLVTFFSPRRLRCFDAVLSAGTLETGITQTIVANFAHSG